MSQEIVQKILEENRGKIFTSIEISNIAKISYKSTSYSLKKMLKYNEIRKVKIGIPNKWGYYYEHSINI